MCLYKASIGEEVKQSFDCKLVYREQKMYQELFYIDLANFLLSFSDAMDMANPSIASHQLRTSFVCLEMGKAGSFSAEALRRIFIGALVHDIGALSPEEKLKIHSLKFEKTNPELHCQKGAALIQEVPHLKASRHIVRFHHRDFKSWTKFDDSTVMLESQILYLADQLERSIDRSKYILHQSKELRSEICAMSGTRIHPEAVELFREVSRREDFWLDLVSSRLYSLLLNKGPCKNILVKSPHIRSISQLFRKVIDLRSKYTSTHSLSVSNCAALLSQMFGLSNKEVEFAKTAGELHDVGKLLIPNNILYKEGRLSEDEHKIMKQHPYHTYSILNSIKGFEYICEWAAFHHERLDGSGYPFHHDESKLTIGARILAVADIFVSLNENRPYREAMKRKNIAEILKKYSAQNFLDKNVVNLVLENYDKLAGVVDNMQFSIQDELNRC